MLQSVFYALSTLVTIYSIVCLIRIVLSWMPDVDYSPVGRFFASLCDPFLSWFQRFAFTRVGMVDFSPILALGVLSILSMIFSALASTGKITIGIIIASLLRVIWSLFSILFVIYIVVLAVRLIYDLVNRYSYSQFWGMLDRFLNPLISRVTGIFTRGRKAMSYRASIILTLIVMILLWLGLEYGVTYVTNAIKAMPF